MFNSNKNKKNKALTESITTIIAKDCTVNGPIECIDFIKVDGTVKGGIKAAGVILGQDGAIQGDVRVKELIAFGKIHGNVTAENVELKSSGEINGVINTQNLQIEQGAIYNGSIAMGQHTQGLQNAQPNPQQVTPAATPQAAAPVQSPMQTPAPQARPQQAQEDNYDGFFSQSTQV